MEGRGREGRVTYLRARSRVIPARVSGRIQPRMQSEHVIRNERRPVAPGAEVFVMSMTEDDELETIELQLLLEGIYLRYGFDFRNYSLASLKRRVWNIIRAERLETISALQDRVLHDSSCMERLHLGLSVNFSSMFRDPEFFR